MIPTPSPQVVLINAVRDVAKALAELIGATKCAAGKAADDPSMYQLKSAAKVKEKTAKTDGCCVHKWTQTIDMYSAANVWWISVHNAKPLFFPSFCKKL